MIYERHRYQMHRRAAPLLETNGDIFRPSCGFQNSSNLSTELQTTLHRSALFAFTMLPDNEKIAVVGGFRILSYPPWTRSHLTLGP